MKAVVFFRCQNGGSSGAKNVAFADLCHGGLKIASISGDRG
jgi:hypothetical protein